MICSAALKQILRVVREASRSALATARSMIDRFAGQQQRLTWKLSAFWSGQPCSAYRHVHGASVAVVGHGAPVLSASGSSQHSVTIVGARERRSTDSRGCCATLSCTQQTQLKGVSAQQVCEAISR